MLRTIMSAIWLFIGYLLQSTVVKFCVYFALFFVVKEFIEVLLPLFPGASVLSSALSVLTPGVWFFLDLFRFDVAVNVSLAAFVTRFIIRRVPLLG